MNRTDIAAASIEPSSEPAADEQDSGPVDVFVEPYEVPAVSSRRKSSYGKSNRKTTAQLTRDDRQAKQNFNAGQVLSLTFSVLGKNPLLYLSLAIFACLPGMFIKFFYGNTSNAEFLINTFFSVIFMGAIVYGVYQDLTGRRAGLGESLAKGLSRYVPLVGISILLLVGSFIIGFAVVFALSVFYGSMLIMALMAIVIGGVLAYFLCVFSVTVPACVVEGIGAFPSIERSTQLTRGLRLPIFGLFLLYSFCGGVAVFLLGLVFPSKVNQMNIAVIVIQPVLTAVYEVFIATLYYQLRAAREGVGVDELSTVFD